MVFAVAGCAFFKQAGQDYQTGKTTPLAQGEVSPQQQSATLTNTISGIPYVNIAAPFIAIGAPFIFVWLRGRRLRQAQIAAAPGTTAVITHPTMVDDVLSFLSTIQNGLFEVGPDGSALKRGWKMTILSSLAVSAVPLIQTSLIPFVTANHPAWMNGAILSLLIGGLAAAEKAISKLIPAPSADSKATTAGTSTTA